MVLDGRGDATAELYGRLHALTASQSAHEDLIELFGFRKPAHQRLASGDGYEGVFEGGCGVDASASTDSGGDEWEGECVWKQDQQHSQPAVGEQHARVATGQRAREEGAGDARRLTGRYERATPRQK